jgi:8-oxo-dGTP diphosphatase
MLGRHSPRTATAKAVCVTPDARVLLCRNHRNEWELPGGRPNPGEASQDAVVREVREETGLDVTVNRLLGVRPLEVIPGAWVDVVAYECALAPGAATSVTLPASREHTQVAFLDPSNVPDAELPQAYRDLIASTAPPTDRYPRLTGRQKGRSDYSARANPLRTPAVEPRARPRVRDTQQSAPKKHKTPPATQAGLVEKNRRRPTLPGPCGPSTIGAEGLNGSVRKGKRCFPLAIATGNLSRPRRSTP